MTNEELSIRQLRVKLARSQMKKIALIMHWLNKLELAENKFNVLFV